ncbi:DUF302 domain-containing protein [Kallotenue papyrolyticum]|uniref:DUF302 domain-containing protein n=1 Tax=Kallotenue papyrolyticum TaxID=1325125 RepID=UPI0004B5C69A|nr:DUF302 domain-containing protein [Kallotenue papyrolyticum]
MSTIEHAYGFGTTLDSDIATAIEQVTTALKAEGFGVLTTIDVQQTLKQKINADVEPYVILGACNPEQAHRALAAAPEIGLLLPCHVIVYRRDGATRVEIADPTALLAIARHAGLDEIADEARRRLRRALDHLTADQ